MNVVFKPDFITGWDTMNVVNKRKNCFRNWHLLVGRMQSLCNAPDPKVLFFNKLNFGSIDITMQRSVATGEDPLAINQGIQNSLKSGNSGITILKSSTVSNSPSVDTSRNAKEIGIIIGSIAAFRTLLFI